MFGARARLHPQPLRPAALALACAAALATLAVPAAAIAQTQQAVIARQLNLALPAQPLALTIDALARQAGVGIGFDANLAAGKTAPALQGEMTLGQALDRALAGTGLKASATGGAVSIQHQGDETGAMLPEVKVTAGASGPTTEGTGSYTTRATGAATRMELSLRETPQSVSVIGRQQIEDQNLFSLTDVLRQTPGIVVDKLDERSNFSSRGFDLSTMIDGVPTLSFDTIAGARNMLTTAIYDRVEVIRGAAGLLNGVGSPGGSINLVRKRPTKEFSGYVTAGGGSWDRYSLEADVGGSLNKAGTVRGRVVAAHSDGHSFIDSRSQRDDTFYGIVEADLAPGTLLAAGYEYQKTAIDGANFGQSPLFFTDGSRTSLPRSFNSSAPWSVWNMTTQRAFVNLEQKFDSGWIVKADASYTKNERQRYSADIWLYPANINATTGNGGVAQVANNPALGYNQAIDIYATGPFKLFGQIHQAMVGANLNRYRYDYGNSSPIPNAFYRPAVNLYNLAAVPEPDQFDYPLNQLTGKTEQKAIYGALQINPVDSLHLLAGGRLTWYKSDTYSRSWTNGTNGALVTNQPLRENAVFTPYAGIVYDVTRQFSVYASYTDIFSPNSARDSSNNMLDPKRGKSYEAGIKGEHFGGRLNTSAAVFQARETNVAVLDSGAAPLPDGSTPYRAVDGARTRGYEFTVSGEVLPGWQVMGGYTYSAKHDASGTLLNTTYPNRLLRIATSYRLPGSFNKLVVGGSLSYQSSIYFDEPYSGKRATQGGVTVLGLMARYEFTRQMSVSLNIDNLTDKYYYSGLGAYNGYSYGTPRNFWAKATYRF